MKRYETKQTTSFQKIKVKSSSPMLMIHPKEPRYMQKFQKIAQGIMARLHNPPLGGNNRGKYLVFLLLSSYDEIHALHVSKHSLKTRLILKITITFQIELLHIRLSTDVRLVLGITNCTWYWETSIHPPCTKIHNTSSKGLNSLSFILVLNRGYYMATRRYEISFQVLKNISQKSAAKEWNIFNTRRQILLFSHVKISCFRTKAHLVFHWCL